MTEPSQEKSVGASSEAPGAGVGGTIPSSESSPACSYEHEPKNYISAGFSLNMINHPIALIKVVEVSEEDAKFFIKNGFISVVGHESTAEFLSKRLATHISVNRTEVKLYPGDWVLVAQIMKRLPEGKILTKEELESVPIKYFIVKLLDPDYI